MPVLYVSAFSNDYVLVPAALTDVSVEAFENQGFVVRRSAADDVDATPAPEPAAPPAEEPPAPDASS